MALLRARADAVMVGANTLRSEPEHLWTAEMICPKDASLFSQLRASEGRKSPPLQIFVSHDGEIHADAAVFKDPSLQVLIATPKAGTARATELTAGLPRVKLIENGKTMVDLASFLQTLRQEYGIENLLCEGGPNLYGSLMSAGLLDDEFLTVSPIVIGNASDKPQRPGVVEGIAFLPETTPKCRIIGLRKAGEHLFLHSRFRD
jgi:riboflavin biosynthesis pyrimidine reductase